MFTCKFRFWVYLETCQLTTQELLQDLSEDDRANAATPSLGSPGKNLELPLMSETSNMRMLLLSAEESKKNIFRAINGCSGTR